MQIQYLSIIVGVSLSSVCPTPLFPLPPPPSLSLPPSAPPLQVTYSVEKVNLYITAEESATGFEIPITGVLKIIKLVGWPFGVE